MNITQYADKLKQIQSIINEIVEKINTGQCNICREVRCSTGEKLLVELNTILPYLKNNDKAKYNVLNKRINALFGQNNRVNPYSFGAVIDIISILNEELNEPIKESNKRINKGEFKINNLSIDKWFILNEFSIEFDENITAIIGENGSGKSSIIEAISLIFGHLYKFFVENDEKAPFIEGYQIGFTSVNPNTNLTHSVVIKSNYSEQDEYMYSPEIKIDGGIVAFDTNCKNLIKNLLPNKIVLYYAGVTERLRELSEHFEKKYQKRIIASNSEYSLFPLNIPNTRPFIYLKKEHIGILLLCLLLSDDEDSKRIISDELRINMLDIDISFEIKKPYWATKSVETIWGAGGDLVNQLIKLLLQEADQKNITENKIEITHQFSYIQDEFRRIFISDIPYKVFEIFDFILFNDLLSRINIRWNTTKGEVIELERMSEGEKQLLIVKSITMLWKTKNALMLFDEPDTFMHPRWQQNMISELKTANPNTQIILSTHSPNIVSSLKKSELKIITQGKIAQNHFTPYGKNVDGVLMDHFGLSSTRNIQVQKMIESIKSDLSDDIKVRSAALDNKIAELEQTIDKTDSEVILIKLEKARRIKHLKDAEN